MNPLKKIYCRTFQTGLKIALPFLPYRKPKIVGSVKTLPEIIQKKKCNKVLISSAGNYPEEEMQQSSDHH